MDQPDDLRRGWDWTTAACALIAGTSLIVMVLFVITTNRSVNAITRARSTSRIVACQTDRESAQKINALNDRTQELLDQTFNAPRATPRDPDTQALIDRYLADQKKKFDAVKVDVRECDPDSIAAYYAGRP